MKRFGAEGFSIVCAMEEGAQIGEIALELGGQPLGDLDQTCVLARVAEDLDEPLRNDVARRTFLAERARFPRPGSRRTCGEREFQ